MSDLFVNSRLTIPESEIEVSAARSSGPGGQNVNKVNTKVILKWNPSRCTGLSKDWCARFVARYRSRINRNGQVVIHSERYRDRARNLQDARGKLVEMLVSCQSAPKSRKLTRPTRSSQRRRLENKRRQSKKKQDRGKSWPDD